MPSHTVHTHSTIGAKEAKLEVKSDMSLNVTDWRECSAVEQTPGRVSGAWVFIGTRVPLHALFENLAGGATINEFVEWFPDADIEQVRTVLEYQAKSLRSQSVD